MIGCTFTLPLAKAIEPPPVLPVLVQLKGQALVPFFLEQEQAGLGSAALGQAVQRQAKRIAGEQDALAKRLEADGIRVTRRHSRLVNALALIQNSEPTRPKKILEAVFLLKKKKKIT